MKNARTVRLCLYPVRRFPRGEPRKTTRHSGWCTLCRRCSLEPSTSRAGGPGRSTPVPKVISHQPQSDCLIVFGGFELPATDVTDVTAVALKRSLCEDAIHCLCGRSRGLCICLWPSRSHRSSQCCSLKGECSGLPGLCGYTVDTHTHTHTLDTS